MIEVAMLIGEEMVHVTGQHVEVGTWPGGDGEHYVGVTVDGRTYVAKRAVLTEE